MITTTEQEDLVIFTAQRGGKIFSLDNSFKPAVRPSATKIKQYMKGASWFTPWGEDDNLWPYTFMDALKACAPAQVCVEILVALFYGNGPVVKQQESNGKVVDVYDAEQQAWFRQSFIYNYFLQASKDFFTSGNQFAQLIKNKKGDGFGMVANISSPFCRLSAINEATALVPNIFIHGSWNNQPSDKEVSTVPLLNPFTIEDQLEEDKKALRFMWKCGNYTPGNIYYDDAPWHALVRNGTMDVFPEIPKIRKNRIKNAMFIKYHVRINEMYWYLKHGGPEKGKQAWEGMTAAERKKQRAAFYLEIDNRLAGSDNAFKSFFTPTWIDRNGNEIKLIQIERIEADADTTAAFDPEKMSNVADVFLAFGIPSAVANTVLSDSKSRGGGSDIREGGTSVITRMPAIRHTLCEPVEYAMRSTLRKNGEPLLAENQFIDFDNTILTTLDKSNSGTSSVSSSTDKTS